MARLILSDFRLANEELGNGFPQQGFLVSGQLFEGDRLVMFWEPSYQIEAKWCQPLFLSLAALLASFWNGGNTRRPGPRVLRQKGAEP